MENGGFGRSRDFITCQNMIRPTLYILQGSIMKGVFDLLNIGLKTVLFSFIREFKKILLFSSKRFSMSCIF